MPSLGGGNSTGFSVAGTPFAGAVPVASASGAPTWQQAPVMPLQSAKVAPQSSVNIVAPGATLDGVAMANGDRVLLTQQADPTTNGVYVFNGAATAMTRAPDAALGSQLVGAWLFVNQGTQAQSGWECTTSPITLETTALTFVRFAAPLLIDAAATDIAAVIGPAPSAGAIGQAADAGHVHPIGVVTAAMYGLYGLAFDPAIATSQAAPVAGTVYGVLVPVSRAITITNVIVWLSIAGVTLTNSFVALYTQAGALVAQSNDCSAAWTGATGISRIALQAPQAVTPGYYYAAFCVGTSGTAPQFARIGATALHNAGLSSPNLRFATGPTGVTTGVAPAAFGAQGAATSFWAAFN